MHFIIPSLSHLPWSQADALRSESSPRHEPKLSQFLSLLTVISCFSPLIFWPLDPCINSTILGVGPHLRSTVVTSLVIHELIVIEIIHWHWQFASPFHPIKLALINIKTTFTLSCPSFARHLPSKPALAQPSYLLTPLKSQKTIYSSKANLQVPYCPRLFLGISSRITSYWLHYSQATQAPYPEQTKYPHSKEIYPENQFQIQIIWFFIEEVLFLFG